LTTGSFVTLELAPQLIAAGRDVRVLVLLDAEGPDGRLRITKIGCVGVHLTELLRKGWPYISGLMAQKGEEREQSATLTCLSDIRDNDSSVAGEEINTVADFVAANTMAIHEYQPQAYDRGITIFRAGDDRFDSPKVFHNGLSWGGNATAGFDMQDIPGDHPDILEHPNVQVLARYLAETLAKSK